MQGVVSFCSKTNGGESTLDLQVGAVRVSFNVVQRSKNDWLYFYVYNKFICLSDLTEALVSFNLLCQVNMQLGNECCCA